jgi:hypothetical protein
MVFLLRFEAATTGPRCDPATVRCLARGGARRGRGIARHARSEATEGWGYPRIGHSPCPAGVRCAVGFADRGSPLDVGALRRGNFGSKPPAYPAIRCSAAGRAATPGAMPACGLSADRQTHRCLSAHRRSRNSPPPPPTRAKGIRDIPGKLKCVSARGIAALMQPQEKQLSSQLQSRAPWRAFGQWACFDLSWSTNMTPLRGRM